MQTRAMTSWAGWALSVLFCWAPMGSVPMHTYLSSFEHAAWLTENHICQLPLRSAQLPLALAILFYLLAAPLPTRPLLPS